MHKLGVGPSACSEWELDPGADHRSLPRYYRGSGQTVRIETLGTERGQQVGSVEFVLLKFVLLVAEDTHGMETLGGRRMLEP